MMALDMAGELPLPTNMERMLQVSIWGDPDGMTVGKFLYCRNPK